MTKTENYHYSSENQLVKIEWFENNVLLKEARYSFDALGRRMQKVVIDHQNSTDKTRRFAYIGQEVIAQLDENNTALAVYTPSGLRTDDTLSVKLTSAGIAAGLGSTSDSLDYLKDGLGSITHLANSNGVVKERYLYSAFGTLRQILNESGAATNSPILEPYHSYTNRELDVESGLYYYRARMYDSSVGRFISSDAFAGVLMNSLTVVNRYNYVLNKPTSFIDPSGKFLVLGAFGIIGAALGPIGFAGLVGATAFYFNPVKGMSPASSAVRGFAVGVATATLVSVAVAGGAVAGAAFGAIFNSSILAGFVGAGVGAFLGVGAGDLGAQVSAKSRGRAATSKERNLGRVIGGLSGAIGGGLGAVTGFEPNIGTAILDGNKSFITAPVDSPAPKSLFINNPVPVIP